MRTLKKEESERMRLDNEVYRLTEQYNKLWKEYNDVERNNRREV